MDFTPQGVSPSGLILLDLSRHLAPARSWIQIHPFLLSLSFSLSTREGGEPLSKLATGSTGEERKT